MLYSGNPLLGSQATIFYLAVLMVTTVTGQAQISDWSVVSEALTILLNNCSLISIWNADVKLKLQLVHMILTMEDEYSPVPVLNGHFNRVKLEQIVHFRMWLLL